MISTSSYKNWQSDKYRTYSISSDGGKQEGYKGACFSLLAPNLGDKNILKEENDRYYVEQYYEQILSKLDPEEIYQKLDNSILLCYEENTAFCHRHIVAAWFELLLGVQVLEKKASNYDIETIERPHYIREYLEDAMRKNRNMRGFNSLRALYLFEKGEQLEEEARKLEDDSAYYIDSYTGQKIKIYDDYMQKACFLRCEADDVEQQYNEQKQKQKILTK